MAATAETTATPAIVHGEPCHTCDRLIPATEYAAHVRRCPEPEPSTTAGRVAVRLAGLEERIAVARAAIVGLVTFVREGHSDDLDDHAALGRAIEQVIPRAVIGCGGWNFQRALAELDTDLEDVAKTVAVMRSALG